MPNVYIWTEHVTQAICDTSNPTQLGSAVPCTILKYQTENSYYLTGIELQYSKTAGNDPAFINFHQVTQNFGFASSGFSDNADIYATDATGGGWGTKSISSSVIAMAGNATQHCNSNGTVGVLANFGNTTFTITNINSLAGLNGAIPIDSNVVLGNPPAGADPITFSSSATVSVEENQTSVGTVQASGGDGTTLTYSITGGVDSTKFSINSSSGALSFNSAPDFETLGSNAGTNAYAIIVTATDGTTPVTQSITVNVTDVNDPTTGIPSITTSGPGTLASPLVGDTLTATSGNIADQDGLGAFSHQWKRGGVNISGATNLTYTIVSADVGSTITVSVSFNDGGNYAVGPLISSATGAVTAPNSPATGLPTITGTASEGGTLTANLGTIADTDGLPGSYTYQWKRDGSPIGGETSSTYTVASADIGTTITVTVSFTDTAGNAEFLLSAGTDIAALDELTYFWTEYFADASNNIPADSTLIHYGIYNTTKISGVQFTYNVSGSTPVADVSYSIVDNTNNNTMIHKKDWPIHIINNRTNTSSTADDGVANKAMIFAGAVNQTINGMNTGVFAVVQGNVTLASIVAVVDEKSDLLATDQYALGEPANPPEITEPGGRKLGDINFDGAVDSTDEDILEAYLLNDTTTTFTVYDDGTTNNATTGKTAEDIITDMTEYDWQTYVDVNNNGIIDVGDLVRLLSKVDDSAFSMTNGT